LVLFLALALLLPPTAATAADPLDPSFGAGGYVVSTENGNGWLEAVSADTSGRLVTVGTTRNDGIIVQRFGPDGSLDRSFGEDGAREEWFDYDAYGSAIGIQPGGRIVAAGWEWDPNHAANYLLSRFQPDGSLDRSFGRRGHVVAGPEMYDGEATAMAFQRDGRILVSGWAADTRIGFSGILMRFKPDGQLDTSFSRNGFSRVLGGWGTFLYDVAVQPDGKIVVAGEMFGRFMMLRMLPDGRSDLTFGKNGFAISDVAPRPRCRCASARSLVVLPSGRLLLAGAIEEGGKSYVALAGYLPNGTLDRGLGKGGVVLARAAPNLVVDDMALRSDGRILLAGASWPNERRSNIALLRYLPGGRPDPSFGRGGIFVPHFAYRGEATSLQVQPDGTTLVTGWAGPREAETEYLLMRLRR